MDLGLALKVVIAAFKHRRPPRPLVERLLPAEDVVGRVDGHLVLALELWLGDHPHHQNGEDDQNDAEDVEEDGH